MAPPPPAPSAQALEQRPAYRRRLLLGVVGFLAIVWYLYSSNVSESQLSQRAPRPHVCPQETLNVAVIGAGSAGASVAYYLNKFRQPCHRLNITIYERNGYVGGRTTTVNANNDPAQPVELGGSIFVPVNHNLVNAVKRFHLPIKERGQTSKEDAPEVLGIWDGQHFVFTQSDASNQYWNIAKMLWKYGISPIRTQSVMKRTVGSFLKMYDAPYFPFMSIAKTALDLDLVSATAATGHQFLENNGISENFGHDIVQAATRVNYAQNLDQIHGLETMVCMAANGGMSVAGGNWQIFDNMIKDSGATLLLNTSVITIAKESERYAIKSTSPTLDAAQDVFSTESIYNTIILASPLQFSNITFSPPLSSPPPAIPYVSLYVTLFTSPYPLSPAAFNLDSSANMPNTILTTTPPSDGSETKKLPFNSISTLSTTKVSFTDVPSDSPDGFIERRSHDTEYLYKIFSPKPLEKSYIESLLDYDPTDDEYRKSIKWIHEKRWDSYPYLPPRTTFEDIRLDEGEGLWYTSGIESFISTMETSSLMGMNVARLIIDEWLESAAKLEPENPSSAAEDYLVDNPWKK
ncbi:MAG: hypothetical protein Q9209_006618 [Squamulea sp. 1 TL-2023]